MSDPSASKMLIESLAELHSAQSLVFTLKHALAPNGFAERGIRAAAARVKAAEGALECANAAGKDHTQLMRKRAALAVLKEARAELKIEKVSKEALLEGLTPARLALETALDRLSQAFVQNREVIERSSTLQRETGGLG